MHRGGKASVKMNLPNKLTLMRVIMIPVFMVFIIFSSPNGFWARIIAAAVFIAASLTDMADGKIARKYGMITDMGKFLDPLADKLLVFGAFVSLLVMERTDTLFVCLLAWASFIVIFREMAVTTMRLLVVNKSNVVIAANSLGKIKTVTQMTCIMTILLEPVLQQLIFPWKTPYLSYLTMAVMTFFTLWSGINYFRQYIKYLL